MNNFSVTEMIVWEKIVAGFNNSNLFAKNIDQYEPAAQLVERSGLTIRTPLFYQGSVTKGLDVSGSYANQTELTVPITLAENDIKNAPFQMSAFDRNDPSRLQRVADAAVRKLSSNIDTHIKETMVTRGALVGTSTGPLSNYTELSKADSMLNEVECNDGMPRGMYVPPRIANQIAGDLGNRQYLDGMPLTAYERATLPPIASFDTFRTNVTTTVSGNAAVGVTVSGAAQEVLPVAYSSDTAPAAGETDDIRSQTLEVSAATYLDGDAFVIAGVNRIGIDTKQDSGQQQTFRVLSGGGTTTLTITPAIVLAGPYQNCAIAGGTLPDATAMTIVNDTDANPIVFGTYSSCLLFKSTLDTVQLGNNVEIMTEVTDSGIQLIFARQGEIDDLSARYRLTAWNRAQVVEPLKCGILLPNQSQEY